MCGINGIFWDKSDQSVMYRMENMNKCLVHRGPDAGNCYGDAECTFALGHRRLSIIDLDTRSKQPMKSNNERWIIVFNGEIYNYKELKKRTTYSYKTDSDTEVILAYIEEFGIDAFLQDCNGMFAIGLYDTLKKQVYLIRDRMGIKPLYYFLDGEKLVFSSEIKGILNSGLVQAEFNENAIDEYLGNRYIRAPYTFFQNIYQIMPGSYKVINKALEEQEIFYWNMPKEFNVEEEYDENIILQKLEKELTRAITERMVADVPVGAYLSGGVDSSLISAIASLNADETLNTYTIGFEELNEFEYARMVEERYHTNHHEILIDSDTYFGKMEEIISYKDAPLGVPNEILLSIMSEELKKDITVVLSGEGADELLGGYGKIFRSPYDYKKRHMDEEYYDYFISLYEYVPRSMRDEYLTVNKTYRNEFDKKIREEFMNRSNEENVFRFFHAYHVKGLLQRVDTTTMLAGVEARVPFLDHKLIEFSYREVPYNLKLHWKSGVDTETIQTTAQDYSEKLDTPKYILKKISETYLPHEVIYRKKVGFPVPLNNWFLDLAKEAKEILRDAYWINQSKIDELVNDCKQNSRAGQVLWMFINVELFRKKYFMREWRY